MVDITNVIATLNFIKLFGHSACNFFFHFFLDKKVDSRYRYALGTCGKKSRLQKNAPDIATLIGIFDKLASPAKKNKFHPKNRQQFNF